MMVAATVRRGLPGNERVKCGHLAVATVIISVGLSDVAVDHGGQSLGSRATGRRPSPPPLPPRPPMAHQHQQQWPVGSILPDPSLMRLIDVRGKLLLWWMP